MNIRYPIYEGVYRILTVMQRFLQVPEEELEQYAVSRLIALYREK